MHIVAKTFEIYFLAKISLIAYNYILPDKLGQQPQTRKKREHFFKKKNQIQTETGFNL